MEAPGLESGGPTKPYVWRNRVKAPPTTAAFRAASARRRASTSLPLDFRVLRPAGAIQMAIGTVDQRREGILPLDERASLFASHTVIARDTVVSLRRDQQIVCLNEFIRPEHRLQLMFLVDIQS